MEAAAPPPSPYHAPPWRWPRIRLRPALMLLGLCVALGLWLGTSAWLALRTDRSSVPASRPFFWELTSVLGAFPMVPIQLTAVLNAPLPPTSGPGAARAWARLLGLHLGAFLLFSAGHITLMLAFRYLLHPLLGWGPYDYGVLWLRVPMEAQQDLIAYGVTTTVLTLYGVWRERQALALREAQLEGELRSTQLRVLMGQLDPHFLFNALNTVSAVMYEDLVKTDRLLSDLGLVLRRSLERSAAPTWTLAEEQGHTERFLALMLARLGERLRLQWELEPGLEALQVPRFALQTLVENALKHNQDRTEGLEIRLRARREAGALMLEVEDTGRGFTAQPALTRGPGLGLSGMRQVLALLYGPEGRLEQGTGAEGGARVRLWLPLSTLGRASQAETR
ncbi:MAG: histidine kinase [Myxococcaceae bacterium]|nr:histidine kinase [Myxococcaceae bacterium]